MSCSACIKTNDLVACAQIIVVGKILEANAGVFVFMKHLATGRINRFESVSDDDGYVEVDVTNFNLIPNQSYEIWITLNSNGVDCRVEITLEDCAGEPIETTYTCLETTFVEVFADDLMLTYYSTQKITI